MAYGVTNPQPSGSPLSLLYKGVFSTRLNGRNKSQYGHYLDKLYQVQFLGVGTHLAETMSGVVNAVMLRQSSIDNRVEVYKATRGKYNESLVLESLGGEIGKRNIIEPASMLDLSLLMKEGKSVGAVLDLKNHPRFSKYARQANDSEVKQVFGERGLNQASLGNGFAGRGFNSNGIEFIDVHGNVLHRADVVMLDSFIRKEGEASLQRDFTVADRLKLAMSSLFLEEVMKKTPLLKDTLLVADTYTVGVLLRKADILTEAAYRLEKESRKMLVDLFHLSAAKDDKTLSLMHYLLYTENEEYRKTIDLSFADHVSGGKLTDQYVVDSMYRLGKDLLDKYGNTSEYQSARELVTDIGLTYSDIRFNDLIKQGGETLRYRMNGSSKVAGKVNIEFDHDIKADDSQAFSSFLDLLYRDFQTLQRQGSELRESGIYGGSEIQHDALILEYVSGDDLPINKTKVYNDYYLGNTFPGRGSVLDYDSHGALWSESQTFISDSRDIEAWGELSSTDEALTWSSEVEIAAELTNEETALTYSFEYPLLGESVDKPQTLVSDYDVELWGEGYYETKTLSYEIEREIFGEQTNEPVPLQPELREDVIGVKLFDNEGFANKDYDIAVLSCSKPDLKYRRRPPLEPDRMPDDPLFEWTCAEGYVCDDWLIVPLKDFNFENPEQDSFYDPTTLKPYYPTGQTDNNGDPYVLPPYSILNEPLSNGVDVGGKQPMSIDPCNLYSFIQYAVKIYDAYKARFHASSPVDTISRVMNLLFEQVQKLISEWDETKGYTSDELWRIYRFIRWMALGITNRFYRVKLEYTYGDFIENFEVYPFDPKITTEGSVRKAVNIHGWVLEGHPIIESAQNKAYFDFTLPQKTLSSTISFELGNTVPDRPDDIAPGGTLLKEDFEGLPDDFKIKGNGWVPVQTQSGISLGVEDPAQVKTYATNSFNVPSNANSPSVHFNYGIDTNMNTKLLLKKSDGTVAWQSSGVVGYGSASKTVSAGDYHFEVTVPQSESSAMQYISFTAQQIQDEWRKVGYQTEWRVNGNVIYEDENTPGIAMVINPQWMRDSEYELEVEFFTEDIPANYPLIDWIGVVLNYRDDKNYYLFGTWSDLDMNAKGGLTKMANGYMQYDPIDPKWKINPDFRFKLNHWHKLKAVVKGNSFFIYIDGVPYLDVTDYQGWGFGSSGLAVWSNPKSSFRNLKYKGKPRFDCFIDNVVVDCPSVSVPVSKPKYAIDFYLDDDVDPRIRDYLSEGKRAYSFPILVGEHKARWVFKKDGSENSIPQDASFIDNVVVKGMKAIKAEVVEEFIGCGGHFAVKLLIENLLEYYRRHHQGCKGRRDIWIIE